MKTICPILTKLYTRVCDHTILIRFDSHGNRFSHLGVTTFICKTTTGQISTLLGALASNIHRCLSYMCRLSWIIIIALTFCGKKWTHFLFLIVFTLFTINSETLKRCIFDKSNTIDPMIDMQYTMTSSCHDSPQNVTKVINWIGCEHYHSQVE